MTLAGDLMFVLPGEWLSLDVRGGDDVVAKRIRDLVERTLGKRDDLAHLRHSTRDALAEAVRQARIVKADYLHLSQSLADVPISVALTISRPGISLPVLPTREAEQQTLLGIAPGGEPTIVAHPQLVVVRSVDRIEQRVDPDGVAQLPRLTANFWIEVPDSGQLVVFSFSSSMTGVDDELLLLFDAVISTVRRRDAGSEGGDEETAVAG